MLKKIVAILITIIIPFSFLSCKSNEKTRYDDEFLLLFDTVTEFVAYTKTEEEFTQLSKYVYDELKIYHELYDIYNNYEGVNNIKTVNDGAGKAPVKVDKKIIDLLLMGKDMYVKTNAKLNIAFGSVLSIWHCYRTSGIDDPENAELPTTEELQLAAKHINIDDVIIDVEASTIFLKDADMSLDVGAIGKGYAVEQVCRMVEEKGFTNALLSVGGNVRTIGTKGDNNTPWNIGVKIPDTSSDNTVLYNVNLTDASLVTSGNYERYYTVNGKNYNHIIDPVTLMPAEYFASVVIICSDSGMADCLSTSLFNMSLEEGKALIENTPDTGALWVGLAGEITMSSYFEDCIKK